MGIGSSRLRGMALALALLMGLVSCAPREAAPAVAAAQEPTAVPMATAEGPTAAPMSTPKPPNTPVPTDTPSPDPLAQTWTLAGAGFTLTLEGDGTYWADVSEREASGYYEAAAGLLTFETEDGQVTRLPYACDGQTLTLFQKGQADLVLTADPATALSIAPNAPGVLPAPAGEGPAIAYAYANRAVVTVELAQGTTATEYCFSCLDTPPGEKSRDWLPVDGDPFRVFKYDGDYYIFLRDEEGRVSEPYPITVDSGYLYPIKAQGLSALRTPLAEMFEEKGTSVTAMNEAVAADIAEAGIYTREGAVTSAVSAVSHMAELGYTIPYQGEGKYQDKDDWGFNPEWGARLKFPTKDGNGTYYFTGMQCVGSIVWALKQAGLDISNGATGWQIGLLGEVRRSGDNKIKYYQLRSGDFIQVRQHYEMVVDRVDTDRDGTADAFLLYEMESPHLSLLLLSFQAVAGRTHFNMDAVYANEGRLNVKNRIWQGTSHIPREDFPPWLTKALEHAAEDRALDRLLRRLALVGPSEHFSPER